MNNKDTSCIFCKIVKGEFDSAKIWENKDFLAILDVNPNTKGMTLVLPKKHYDSYIFNMEKETLNEFIASAKTVAKILERYFKIKRVALVAEGMGVNHAHFKLYPLHGITDDFKEMWAKEKIYFEKYQGYISTQLGEKKEMSELESLAKEIRKLGN